MTKDKGVVSKTKMSNQRRKKHKRSSSHFKKRKSMESPLVNIIKRFQNASMDMYYPSDINKNVIQKIKDMKSTDEDIFHEYGRPKCKYAKGCAEAVAYSIREYSVDIAQELYKRYGPVKMITRQMVLKLKTRPHVMDDCTHKLLGFVTCYLQKHKYIHE